MDGLTIATIAANTAMGLVYVAYGTITLLDVRRHAQSRGASHLGYGFAAIMYTCGPHHLDHAAHLALSGEPAIALDLVTVGLGLPVGLTWFLLRLEAMRGGRGDRDVHSDLLVDVYRTIWAAAFVLIAAAVVALPVAAPSWGDQVLSFRVLPNLLVMVLYLAIGAVLLRTQLRRRAADGHWSLSGLALTAVFPTCAGMHAMLVGAAAVGSYEPDVHLLLIDTLSVPAAGYFLAVIWLLSEGRLADWSEPAGDVAGPGPVDDVLDDRTLPA